MSVKQDCKHLGHSSEEIDNKCHTSDRLTTEEQRAIAERDLDDGLKEEEEEPGDKYEEDDEKEKVEEESDPPEARHPTLNEGDISAKGENVNTMVNTEH